MCTACFRIQTREANRRYRERHAGDPVFREARNLANRQYYNRYPERSKAATERWKGENADRWREYQRAMCSARRTKMSSSDDNLRLAREYRSVLACDPCSYCGATCEEIDHATPVAQGGKEVWENLTASCASCNRSKKAKTPLLWMAKNG